MFPSKVIKKSSSKTFQDRFEGKTNLMTKAGINPILAQRSNSPIVKD